MATHELGSSSVQAELVWATLGLCNGVCAHAVGAQSMLAWAGLSVAEQQGQNQWYVTKQPFF